ncbi:UNVERIFIED_ORG: DNA-binding transcriptional regulator YdaS (Cro superfamily) [Paraburkholderia sediminicola]|nr:DNA-binding transcriptional regulator YdaS (Cro superfamily) [Paraburkholderia sediminicola]
MFYIANNVKIAIARLGGPTKAAHLAEVSNATIHNWIKRARIVNIDKARLVAKLCGMDVQDLRPTR